jgi:hypothetical protein
MFLKPEGVSDGLVKKRIEQGDRRIKVLATDPS